MSRKIDFSIIRDVYVNAGYLSRYNWRKRLISKGGPGTNEIPTHFFHFTITQGLTGVCVC